MSAATFYDFDGGRRRGLRRTLAISAGAHAAVVAFFLIGPSLEPRRPLGTSVVTVELVAAPPAPARRAPRRVAPPAPRKVVLPSRPERSVAPAPVVEPQPKPEEQDYEELLKQLRAEAGERQPEAVDRTPPPAPVYETPEPPAVAPAPAPAATVAQPGAPAGQLAPPEVVAWVRDARIHVRREWVLQAGFRLEALETHVEVELDAEGNVQGDPRITQRSGNPWYDESVVRAIQKADPLPAPPEAGRWPFVFRPEDY